ncbi:cytochrome C [Maribacter algicola]|uniref:Cytochrome C n=1 Tax=Maribacter algicola TaxID=2498892 RepID=A0A3R8Q3W9_9FLAO|nr:PQQ-dependent sugar dehydrogenase [Maribacter algicola]RRQ49259.1 cytochrome C [Maribacter algicola]
MLFLVPKGQIYILLGLCLALFSCNSSVKKDLHPKAGRVDNYRQDELSVQKGMQLFNMHCASCHDFNADNIGPNLAGVTLKADKAWLTDFIRNPKRKIEAGDERSVQLYEAYSTYMPAFGYFSEDELEALLGFIHKYSEAERKSKKKRPGALSDPITEKINESNLLLVLDEVLQVPASAEHHPKARINKLAALRFSEGERLFIADLNGKLYEAKDSTVKTYLDMVQQLPNFINAPGFGTGLGSFDIHPNFEQNGLLYTTHTEPAHMRDADFALPDSLKVGLQWVLTEWKAQNPEAQHFSGSKRELLRVDMLGSSHGFQEVSFNPMAKKGDSDYGLLYLCIGDGGAIYADKPQFVGRKDKIWGSVIRIDPLGNNSVNGRYGIPYDNPFVGNSEDIPEIWAYGFRNPHRISWDALDQRRMYVSNIGRHSVEEVNLVEKGGNYGWPNREGTFVFDADANTEVVYPLPKDDNGFAYPIIQYDHDEGNAVSGGYTYHGTLKKLQGKYLFGDIPRGTLFMADVTNVHQGQQAPIQKIGFVLNGEATSFDTLLGGARVDLRWGMDSAGELYLFTKYDGKVYKVVDCIAKDTLSS